MKRLNKVLIAVIVLIIIAYLVIYISGTLHAQSGGICASASDYPETFSNVLNILRSDTAIQVFSTEVPSSEEGVYLVAIDIDLTNKGFLNAEWVECTLQPASGDIAVYSIKGTGLDISSGQSNTVTMKILTRTPEEKRNISVSYYILGSPRKINVTV